jgi:hypothetical protein
MKKLPASPRKGINVLDVATSLEPPKVPRSPNILGEAAVGPNYEPGTYTIKLVKGDETYTTTLVLNSPGNLSYPEADSKLQRETLMKAYHMLEALATVDQKILDTRDTLKVRTLASKGDKLKKINTAIAECEKMHEKISATQPGEGAITGQVRLRENIAEVYGAVNSYLGRPTNLQLKALDLYETQINEFSTEIDSLIKTMPDRKKK